MATLLAVAAVSTLALTADASSNAQQAQGHLRSQAFTVGCTSPVGLCTAGRMDGVVEGDFVFTAESLVASDTPSVFFYTGHIVVQTSRGQLTCQDAGAYSFRTRPDRWRTCAPSSLALAIGPASREHSAFTASSPWRAGATAATKVSS